MDDLIFGSGPYAVSQPVTRTEDPRLLRGEGQYTDDKNLTGQAYLLFGGASLAALDAEDGSQDGIIELSSLNGGNGFAIYGTNANESPGAPIPPATSSPIRITRSSRSISWRSASLMACR